MVSDTDRFVFDGEYPDVGDILKKKELEMTLQGLQLLPRPSAELEQYSTPTSMATDILFTAYSLGDIQEMAVFDLGCGNGIFSIGASLLGAREVTGVDVDPQAIEIACDNAESLGLDVAFVRSNVTDFKGRCDTVIQNPPFGSQKRGADRPFLRKAMECGRTVYTLHMEETERFLMRIISDLGGRVEYRRSYKFNIPHMFGFHNMERKSVDIVMLLIRR